MSGRRILFASFLLLYVYAGAGAQTPNASDPPPIISTASGMLQGMRVGAVDEFLGVPYAAPPIGALRFAPPQPAAAWSGVRSAQAFGSPCAQPASYFGLQSNSEDCLYLNVYAPASGEGPLPIMLWIHGGSFVTGEGSDYDGAALAARGHVVVVTINYRLGPFGFLSSPVFDAASASGTSGNYGLMDQQAALSWIQKNAAAFGADGTLITVFGQSAGGQSVVDLLASPTAAGLFSRAIIESGAYAPQIPTLSSAETTQADTINAVGCGDSATLDCLRALPASAYLTLEAAQAQSATLAPADFYYGPVIAAPVLPTQPLAAFATGQYNVVPVIDGSNHDEARVFVGLLYDLQGQPLTAASYPGAIDAVLGAELGTLTQVEYPLIAYSSPDAAFGALATDLAYSCSATLLNITLALHGPLYAYEFAVPDSQMLFVPPSATFPYLASHTNEIGYLFPAIKGPVTGYTEHFTPAQAQLSATMMSEWAAFASTGSPNGAGLPAWQPYSSLTLQNLVAPTPAPISSLDFDAYHKCAYWLPIVTAVEVVPSLL